jgi:hypothetical protein
MSKKPDKIEAGLSKIIDAYIKDPWYSGPLKQPLIRRVRTWTEKAWRQGYNAGAEEIYRKMKED